jgi:3-hydroxyisobutyrate dehydrogenase
MNIGFVGVGRMGGNMVRHLKDRQFPITAIYDVNRAKATSIAAEVGCAASQHLSEVTAASDVVFTVVTDDKDLYRSWRQLTHQRTRQIIHQL